MYFKTLFLSAATFIAVAFAPLHAEAYSPAGDRIKSPWADSINPQSVWQEYPRPTLVRDRWENLNGLWNYAVTPRNSAAPRSYEGEILVPFPIESSLSGVGRTVGRDSVLWYNRHFDIPKAWKGEKVMLNFGGVDWQADVWVNGMKVGSHKGGFSPFSIDITPALNVKGNNSLTVKVYDPTDAGYQPRGKQVAKSKHIWYTSVTGIWQTVWLEPVGKASVDRLRIIPDIDSNTLSVAADTQSAAGQSSVIKVKVLDKGRAVAEGSAANGEAAVIEMPADVKLWSPDSPYLYDLEITLLTDGRVSDRVSSYAAMRKISLGRDGKGIVRMMLNNRPLFQFGPLDQGWWPDGLYTAPSYEAMVFDIDKTKDWGFNMIRKHMKVEPSLWYAYCDRKGILVWQDMPCGDKSPQWQRYKYFEGKEMERTAESEANFRREWQEIMDAMMNHPSIVVWTPFNEAWGQFKTKEIAEWTKLYDSSRLVDAASGGNYYDCGDILDLHQYPAPTMYLFDRQKANAIGEYGGIGRAIEGHTWNPAKSWGYKKLADADSATQQYVDYTEELLKLIDAGFAAAVYTQTTDVEAETNGLMTYDRKIMKFDEERLRKANEKVCGSLDK